MALGNGKTPANAANGTLTQNNVTNSTTNEKAPVVNGTNVETLPRTGKQTDPNTAFLRAARAGQLDKIQEYLDSGTVRDINTSNANGLNALHLAAKDGHIEVVRDLLKRGAIVDAATKKGNTALHIASLAGQEEVVRMLVQHGAAINVQSQNGFSPLYMAAQENHDGVVKYLLSKGANQTLSTEDGFTPLAVAMQQGHDKVVAVLLEHDTRGKVRLPALHIAAKKDDVKAASLLLENEHNPDITSKSGFTPLHIAAHYGNDNVAQLLYERGADVNYAAKHNITPLHVASKWGKVSMVALLMEKGANIEAKTRDGLTPLHCAARSGHDQVCDMLLEKGAPIYSKTKNGLAPLHMAAQGDHIDAARVLLRRGAPVDEVTVDYLTALHVAAHCGHVRVAKLLLDKKAHADARALNGFTPLHIACKKNRAKVVELLLKYGASISATTESGLTPLHVASFMGCMNIVIYLLQNDASPDVPTVRGETPLHLAARANQTDIIRILLRNGASVDARAREQQTPLHVASRLGNADIVVLLLQHGAQPDAPTADLYTPLHIAAKEGQEDVASVLLDNNASVTATTKKGFTPLHLASKYGHLGVARLIIARAATQEANFAKQNNDVDEITKDSVNEDDAVKAIPSTVVDAAARNGVTPLHVAAHYDRQPVALLLLESGASPQAAARNGHTPLHIAAKKNQMDIATTLLEHGATANTESKAGFTPLHLSAQEGHNDMSALLIEHQADPNHSAKNGLTPLHLAAQYDKVDVGRILLNKGADPNATTKSGYTPLHVASHHGNANMVRLLLENGASVSSSTELGYTPLHQAAQQGHTLVINLLLKSKADPNAVTNNGHTALSIANKLGYISVIETLKVVTTETTITSTITATLEEKYKVVAPEAMHDTFMSDSEDEGGCSDEVAPLAVNAAGRPAHAQHVYLPSYYQGHMTYTREDPMLSDQQQYRYMTVDDMKSLGDDSMRLDVTNDERHDNRDSKAHSLNSDIIIHPMHVKDQYAMNSAPDNVDIARQPIHAGVPNWKNFLVSFLVDARGGAMRGCRHSGVRVIVPPRSACSPTRVTCRYVRPLRPSANNTSGAIQQPPPLPLGEGEALASRILELGPLGAKFLGPVILEVPHFASLRGMERELVVFRSDTGENWREHSLDASNEAVQDVLQEGFEGDELSQLEDLPTSRIIRILTNELPRYIAVIHRGRQDGGAVGPEGGTLSCRSVPQAQAVFPSNALTKRIRVALQAQPMDPALVCRVLGRTGIAVSPVLTVEPRRRKFHRAITLGLPAPKAHSHGMINQYQSGGAPTLRLLCSITGGQNRAVWEDVTGSTPLTFVKDCVTFTTTVSARFWLMDCRNTAEATRLATDLYTEACRPPFMAKFVVFAKRTEPSEANLRVFCMTDDKEDKTLETQENFIEVAKSRDVEVLEGKSIYIECAGNLIPVTKSGEQLSMSFHAFQENRLAFAMRVRNMDEEPICRILFMSEPKVAKGEPAQVPICTLNISLPEVTDNKQLDSLSSRSDSEAIHRADICLPTMGRLLDADWPRLAVELDPPVAPSDIDILKAEYPHDVTKQATVMLRLWLRQAGKNASGNTLAETLHKIGRSDIVDRCIGNVELVTDNTELALAQTRLDQSGFDALRDELGPSRDSTLSRSVILDKNRLDDQTFDSLGVDRSGFDALKDELGPSRNESRRDDYDHSESDSEKKDETRLEPKMSSLDKDITDTISDFLDYKEELKIHQDQNESQNNKDACNDNRNIDTLKTEAPLKSILKKGKSPSSPPPSEENQEYPVDTKTLEIITQQLDELKMSPSQDDSATPPPSPAEYFDSKRSPVPQDNACRMAENETWTSDDLHISEGPDTSQDSALDSLNISSSELKDDILKLSDKEITNSFLEAETQSKIPLAAKTSTPVKIKTIKKHTKLPKELAPPSSKQNAQQRPTVEDINWDFGYEKSKSETDPSETSKSKNETTESESMFETSHSESKPKSEPLNEYTHSVETFETSPVKVQSKTTITKIEPDGEKTTKVIENDEAIASNIEEITNKFAANNASCGITRTVTETGPNGEKITRTYTEYPEIYENVTVVTETGPNGEQIVRTVSGNHDISPELLEYLKENPATETVTRTVTEIGPNGEKIVKTITENPLVYEVTSKVTEYEPKITKTVTELREYDPNVKIKKSKIPVYVNETVTKSRREVDSDSDTDNSRQSPIGSNQGIGNNNFRGSRTGGRTIGSSSGSDIALHEGISEDEAETDFYQSEQPTYTENTVEEIDPVTGAKITRTMRTVTQTVTSPTGRDVNELRDSMQHVLDQFLTDERKAQ